MLDVLKEKLRDLITYYTYKTFTIMKIDSGANEEYAK
jgi:hypothetical protein